MLDELTRSVPHLVTAAVSVLLLLAAVRVVPRDGGVRLWLFAAVCVLIARLPGLMPAGILAPLGPVAGVMHLVALLAILAGVERHCGRPGFGPPVRISLIVAAIVYTYAFTTPTFTQQSLVTSPVVVVLLLLIGLRLGSGDGPVERRVVPIVRWMWIFVALSSAGRAILAVLMRAEVVTGPEAAAALTILRVANPTLFSTAMFSLSLVAFSQLADAYAEAQRRADEARMAKGRLLANMSHDLRTPLNAIMGFAELIREATLGPISARYREYGDDIHRSAGHLLDVINRVLTASELESGRRRLLREVQAIDVIMRDSIRLVSPQAEARGVAIQAAPADGQLLCDSVAIVEILSNLLANAIAVSPPGAVVELGVDRSEREVTFTVSDRGPGLPAQVLADLGRPFNRAGDAFVASAGRGGLGLSISLGLTELHGGALVPSSRPGGGTVMTLRLPATRMAEAA